MQDVYWKLYFYRTKYHLDQNELESRMREILQYVTIQDTWFSELKQNQNIKGLARILFNFKMLILTLIPKLKFASSNY